MSLTEFNQEEYDRNRWREALAVGQAQGISQGISQTARVMLSKRLDKALIAECTGLSIEEVSKLQAGM